MLTRGTVFKVRTDDVENEVVVERCEKEGGGRYVAPGRAQRLAGKCLDDGGILYCGKKRTTKKRKETNEINKMNKQTGKK